MKTEKEIREMYDNLLKCLELTNNWSPEIKEQETNKKEVEILESNKYLLECILGEKL